MNMENKAPRVLYKDLKKLVIDGKSVPEGVRIAGTPDDVHDWFELTYAQYLTVPRSILESMPHEWQYRFVECLKQLENTFNWIPENGRYRCTLMTEIEQWDEHTERFETAWGEEINDPLAQYRHPNYEHIEKLRISKLLDYKGMVIEVVMGDKPIPGNKWNASGFIWRAYKQVFQPMDVIVAESDIGFETHEKAFQDAFSKL